MHISLANRITLFALTLALAGVIFAFAEIGFASQGQASDEREMPAPVQAPNEHEAYPGGEITGGIQFQNQTPDTLPLRIEVSDFVPGKDGKIVVDESPDAARSLKGWMELLMTTATVRPGESVAIEYSIHVPKDAAPGSRWAALRMTTPPIESVSGERRRFNMSAVVLLRVLGDAAERLAVGGIWIRQPETADQTAQVLTVRFVNGGDIHVKPHGAVVEVFNLFGKQVARVALPEQNVLPGYARIISAELPAPLMPGLYWARLEGGYGAENSRLSALRLLWIAPSVSALFSVGLAVAVVAGVIWVLVARRSRPAAED